MKRNMLVLSILLGTIKTQKNEGEQIKTHELVPETQQIALDQDEINE